jgi:hypothetical protein
MQPPFGIVQWGLYESIVTTKVISRRFQSVEVGHRHHDVSSGNDIDWSTGIVG